MNNTSRPLVLPPAGPDATSPTSLYPPRFIENRGEASPGSKRPFSPFISACRHYRILSGWRWRYHSCKAAIYSLRLLLGHRECSKVPSSELIGSVDDQAPGPLTPRLQPQWSVGRDFDGDLVAPMALFDVDNPMVPLRSATHKTRPRRGDIARSTVGLDGALCSLHPLYFAC